MDQEEHKQQYMEVYIDFQKKVLPHPHKSPTPELFYWCLKFSQQGLAPTLDCKPRTLDSQSQAILEDRV
jgi:hypothetical protein